MCAKELTNNDSLSIKSWAEDDRPREKFMAKGRSALSDAELIAILIGSGNKNESAVELSKKILSSVGNNLNRLGQLSLNDFYSQSAHKGRRGSLIYEMKPRLPRLRYDFLHSIYKQFSRYGLV